MHIQNPLQEPIALMRLGWAFGLAALVLATASAVWNVSRLNPLISCCVGGGVAAFIIASYQQLATHCDEERRIAFWSGRSSLVRCPACQFPLSEEGLSWQPHDASSSDSGRGV